jgi:hypothetical protein
MSSASTPGASPSRGPLVTILAVIGILAIIAGILYVSGAANSLHFMDGARHKGHHQYRAIVSFVVGIAFLIGAYIAKSRPAAGSRGSAGTGSSTSTAGTGSSTSTAGTGSSTSTAGSTTSTTDGGGSASSPDSASGSATPSGT